MTRDEAIKQAAKYQKWELYQVATKFAGDVTHWQFIAITSLLLNMWLAYLAGVL